MPAKKAKAKPVNTIREGSLVHTLLQMPVGSDHAVLRWLDPEVDDLTPSGITKIKCNVNSAITRAVGRVKKSIEASYQVEGVVFNTTRNRLYVALIVTRTR